MGSPPPLHPDGATVCDKAQELGQINEIGDEKTTHDWVVKSKSEPFLSPGVYLWCPAPPVLECDYITADDVRSTT